MPGGCRWEQGRKQSQTGGRTQLGYPGPAGTDRGLDLESSRQCGGGDSGHTHSSNYPLLSGFFAPGRPPTPTLWVSQGSVQLFPFSR